MLKASLETLARTASVFILVITAITVGNEQTKPAMATQENEIFSVVAPEPKQKEQKAKIQKPASQRPAPKDIHERGLWVKEILKEAGFRGENLKEAWAIVMRESTGRPNAYNGNTSTGDNSYGIFQINMIGELGVARREKFDLKSNKDLFDPLRNAEIAHYMSRGGKDWSSWDIDNSGYNGGVGKSRYREWLAKYPRGN